MRTNQSANQKQIETARWLDAMGRPDQGPLFIHLAGTNGKGSTGSFLSASLQALTGCPVGHFLSPHVHRYHERILIGGEMIGDEELLQIQEKMNQLEKDFSLPALTYFQRSFLEAMEAFKDLKLAVIECGVGGKNDVTNVIDAQIAVISRIGMDHMNVLGDTLEKIADQKSGIIRKNHPLISSDQEEPAKRALMKEAEKNQAPAFFLDPKWLSPPKPVFCSQTAGPINMSFSYDHGWLSGKYETSLLGLHQGQNLGTALLALEVIADPHSSYTPKISTLIPSSFDEEKRRALIQESVKSVYLPGRLEVISTRPLLLIDGAHNDPAILTLIENLHWLGLDGTRYPRPALLFGMHDHKVSQKVQKKLFQEMDQVSLIEVEGKNDSDRNKEVKKALSKALKEKPERPVLVCGSFYLLDGAKIFLNRERRQT